MQGVSEMCALDLGLDFEMPSDLHVYRGRGIFLENAYVVGCWSGIVRLPCGCDSPMEPIDAVT